MRCFATACLLVLAGSADSPPAAAAVEQRKRTRSRCLLLDTDMDLDDAMALSFACLADAADLRAVTVAGTGFTRDATRGAGLVARLLELCPRGSGLRPVVVAAGSSRSLANTSYRFPSAWSDTASAFFDGILPPQSSTSRAVLHSGPHEATAAEVIVDTARSCAAEGRFLDVVTMAPVTNLAQAPRLDPVALRTARTRVFLSGGNLDMNHGNDLDCGGHTNTAECNVFLDAVAARELFQSGLEMHVFDSQASESLPVSTQLPEALGALVSSSRGDVPLRKFFVGAMQNFLVTTDHQIYFYDPAAVVWRHVQALRDFQEASSASSGQFCLERRSLPVMVSLEAAPRYGTLLLESSTSAAGLSQPRHADFCWRPDQSVFTRIFFETLFGGRVVTVEPSLLQASSPQQEIFTWRFDPGCIAILGLAAVLLLPTAGYVCASRSHCCRARGAPREELTHEELCQPLVSSTTQTAP
eukprot:TRINITY_DN88773_c0_g1_i1.p1 TRINITY_DN88773_c0_g1~~TRINITY_DN88773_c0_g1_i1.p1  ORF type:complete len:470 (-),score=72.35 TRINITY_DN88773_c0_g1_i1:90-1499(-)